MEQIASLQEENSKYLEKIVKNSKESADRDLNKFGTFPISGVYIVTCMCNNLIATMLAKALRIKDPMEVCYNKQYIIAKQL